MSTRRTFRTALLADLEEQGLVCRRPDGTYVTTLMGRRALRDAKRAKAELMGERVFVYDSERKGHYCPNCIPPHIRLQMGTDGVETWRELSDGWAQAPICLECRLAIPVYVNVDTIREGEDQTPECALATVHMHEKKPAPKKKRRKP